MRIVGSVSLAIAATLAGLFGALMLGASASGAQLAADSHSRVGRHRAALTTAVVTLTPLRYRLIIRTAVNVNEHKDEWRDHRKRVQRVCPGIEQRTRALSRLDRYTSTQGEPLDSWFLGALAV
ncbi:hypothetical protein KEC56_00560 [Microbacterium sp. YMB-B2]|uniref:Uncharacterized protein n=1 Tax=Microbacterium tenebrionis TaxID=2830665 RepID=A0A9X1RZB3_9MICO|nr:hypothetical protein [Microbacterium tenebrionis]MCC2028032.1 hypothetical protein [Microbacterium tenebrionis]